MALDHTDLASEAPLWLTCHVALGTVLPWQGYQRGFCKLVDKQHLVSVPEICHIGMIQGTLSVFCSPDAPSRGSILLPGTQGALPASLDEQLQNL